MNDREPTLKKIAPAGIAVVAVFSITSGPLLRFADPVYVWSAGLLVAFALIVLITTDIMGGSGRRFTASLIFLSVALLTLSRVADYAATDIAANDKRCLAVQHDMLSQHPLRSDGPDLFQALGCRPQGEGSVHAPPSEAMIEVHEWLPWGGGA